jgi:predicted transcriptional regulator
MISCREILSVFSGASGRLDAGGRALKRLWKAIIAEHLQAAFARLTPTHQLFTLRPMEVNIGPDLQAKLARLATERGSDTQALVREAIERLVDYDEWFLREVESGLAAADRGELIDHEEIGKLINRRYPG